MKTAIIVAVMLGLAAAQQDGQYRGRPFQNSNANYQPQQQKSHQQHQLQQNQQQHQQQRENQQQESQLRQQQQSAQPVDHNGQYQEQNSQYQEPARAVGANDRQPSTTTFIPILHWNKQQEHDGTYSTSYETGNNIISEETGYLKTIGEGEDQSESLVQRGSYSYMSPDGQLITVTYTADETGFHATGDHIPTPPPVSEEIQKGLDLIYAGIKQQQEAAAREAASRPAGSQQPIDTRQQDDQTGRYRA